MSKTLTIGEESFEYPTENQASGWGSEATDFAAKVAERLNTLTPAGSIDLTTFAILGSQTDADVTGFIFDSGTVVAFSAFYYVSRVSSGYETGWIEAVYNGSLWEYSIRPTGDANITLEVTSTGQIRYTTTGADAGTMKFRSYIVIPA